MRTTNPLGEKPCQHCGRWHPAQYAQCWHCHTAQRHGVQLSRADGELKNRHVDRDICSARAHVRAVREGRAQPDWVDEALGRT